MSIHTLTERAMVMNLSIGIWHGHRLDKAATSKVTEEAGAASDAARVNKHLVPKSALAEIVTASGAVRIHFYESTLPWRDNGDRLMPRNLYMKFIERHEELVRDFDKAVERFLTGGYLTAVQQAEFRMGAMFNPDDYPPASELRRKFYASLDIDAITTANDFRVQIDREQVDKVRAGMEAAAERRVHAAMTEVWRRIAETVGKFQERMETPDAVFRNSLITNIAELMELIPGLNVLDDPQIEAVRQQVLKRIAGIDPNDIRKDPDLRQELAGEAKQIMDTMSGFMRAFGAGNT